MEVTLTSSQDQSGITTKLWRSHLEQRTEQYRVRNLITMEGQKKQLWHNLTDRESGRDAIGLADRPQEADEVLEGYLSSQLDPPEKCGV